MTLVSSVLVGLVAYQSASDWNPSPTSPCLVFSWVPGLVLLSWLQAAGMGSVVSEFAFPAFALPPAILTWFWLRHLRRSETGIPRRTPILVYLLIGLVPLFLVLGWEPGIQFQGRGTTTCLASQAVAGLVLTLLVGWIAWRRPSWRANFIFHSCLMLYCAWCAIPYLGETL